jgi:hypothetical protein
LIRISETNDIPVLRTCRMVAKVEGIPADSVRVSGSWRPTRRGRPIGLSAGEPRHDSEFRGSDPGQTATTNQAAGVVLGMALLQNASEDGYRASHTAGRRGHWRNAGLIDKTDSTARLFGTDPTSKLDHAAEEVQVMAHEFYMPVEATKQDSKTRPAGRMDGSPRRAVFARRERRPGQRHRAALSPQDHQGIG